MCSQKQHPARPILAAARELVRPAGMGRFDNPFAGISLRPFRWGTVYHYFDSKDDLTAATVESVWQGNFLPRTRRLFYRHKGVHRVALSAPWRTGGSSIPAFSPGTAARLASSGEAVRPHRDRVWQHMAGQLTESDSPGSLRAPRGFFPMRSRPKRLPRLLFSLLLAALIEGQEDPSAILTVTQRTLYGAVS